MTNHGHVTPNADGSKARCGGPGICLPCSHEQSAYLSKRCENPYHPRFEYAPTMFECERYVKAAEPASGRGRFLAAVSADHRRADAKPPIVPWPGPPVASEPTGERADVHRPQRDDAVATWLKRKRDVFNRGGVDWFMVDDLLDDYRLHADTGVSLELDVNENDR